jgi:hypothetical protein
MAKLKNKRLQTNGPITNKKKTEKQPREKKHLIKKAMKSIKEWFLNMPFDLRIFYSTMFVLMFVGIFLIAILTNGILQSGLIVCFLLLATLTSVAFVCIKKRSKHVITSIVAMFCIILTIVSFGMELYLASGIQDSIEINSQIADIKKSSTEFLSTDYATVYLNLDEMKVYTVSNFGGEKYVNENKFSPSEESEYFELYNIGIQIYSQVPEVDKLFIYPPTPSTITGYDYLIEIEHKNQSYVTKVFIPGFVNLDRYMDKQLFSIAYANSNNFYIVSRLNGYFIFQSDLMSWSSPYKNVSYTSEKEYFYVRYNRYLREYWGDDFEEDDEIGEENVRFGRSFKVISPTIQKVNIFWVGHVENNVFIATTPVMEVIYKDNTCDIVMLKDIDISNIDGIVGY